MNASNPNDPRTALEATVLTGLDPDDPEYLELPPPNSKFPGVSATNGRTPSEPKRRWHVEAHVDIDDAPLSDFMELADALREAVLQAEILNASHAVEVALRDIDEWTGPTRLIE